MQLLIKQGELLDPETGQITNNGWLLIVEGVIRERGEGEPAVKLGADDICLDAAGRILMPGLIDAHVHCAITTLNFPALQSKPETLRALEAKPVLEKMLLRGFTTVRDAGGADWGLAAAVDGGLIRGPRIFYSGRVISQTGGHGDVAARSQDTPICACGAMTSFFSHVVDSPDAVRTAVRQELKKGAHQIKFMASGGVA